MSLGVQQLAGFGGGRRAAGGGVVTQSTEWVDDLSTSAVLENLYASGTLKDKCSKAAGGFATPRSTTSKSTGSLYLEVKVMRAAADTNADRVYWGLWKTADWRGTNNYCLIYHTTTAGNRFITGDYTASVADGWTGGGHPYDSTEKTFALACDIDGGHVWIGYDSGSAITWVGGSPGDTGNKFFTDASPGEAVYINTGVADTDKYIVLGTGSDTCLYAPPSGFVYWDA